VGAVPPAKEIENTVWHRYIAKRFERVHERLRQKELDFGLFLTGNISVPTDLLRQAGGFDERFKEYSFEDSELGYRLKNMGVTFAHAPKAVGRHFFCENLNKICAKAYEAGRSQSVFLKLHPELLNELQCHSISILPWQGVDIVKNMIKLLTFNWLARSLLRSLVTIIGWVKAGNAVHRLLAFLELQYHAAGIGYSRGSEVGVK
jgi:GT2 family glycosyltransferase